RLYNWASVEMAKPVPRTKRPPGRQTRGIGFAATVREVGCSRSAGCRRIETTAKLRKGYVPGRPLPSTLSRLVAGAVRRVALGRGDASWTHATGARERHLRKPRP